MLDFRAAVVRNHGAPLEIEQVRVGELHASDVLVRIGATSLCHTDLEAIDGSRPCPLPTILGHEAAGTVEGVGAEVRSLKAGDRVVISVSAHCGHCFYCERGQHILCEPSAQAKNDGGLLDGTSRLASPGGEPIYHFMLASTLADYAVVPESGAVKVPDAIPFDRACLIGCGVITGVGAVTRIARLEPGATLAVIGCGAVGLSAVQGGRLAGARSIVAIDPLAQRRQTAEKLGASVTVGTELDEVRRAVLGITGGRGADCVIEAAGNEAAFRLACEISRPGGQIVFLGKVHPGQDVSFRWGSLMGDKKIIRSAYGGARPGEDFPWLAQCYLDGRLLLDELVTAHLPLSRVNEGFDAMRRAEGIRTVVVPDP